MDVRVNLIEDVSLFYVSPSTSEHRTPGIFAYFIHILKPYYHLTKISKSLSAKFASQKVDKRVEKATAHVTMASTLKRWPNRIFL
jgi:hypothetical protein